MKRHADSIVEMLKAGVPRTEVAQRHGVSVTTVTAAWRGRIHGVWQSTPRPDLTPLNPPPATVKRPEEVMDKVAALRHEEGVNQKQIAQRLGLPAKVHGEAHRPWHEQHPDGPDDIPGPCCVARPASSPPHNAGRSASWP